MMTMSVHGSFENPGPGCSPQWISHKPTGLEMLRGGIAEEFTRRAASMENHHPGRHWKCYTHHHSDRGVRRGTSARMLSLRNSFSSAAFSIEHFAR